MRLGLEKLLRTRSASCAFSSSKKARVMLEMLHLKSFARLENAPLCIYPVVLLRKRCPIQQQSVEQLRCVA